MRDVTGERGFQIRIRGVGLAVIDVVMVIIIIVVIFMMTKLVVQTSNWSKAVSLKAYLQRQR